MEKRDKDTNLTPMEQQLLDMFDGAGDNFVHESDLACLWDTPNYNENLRKLLSRLRGKRPGLEIETVHGQGYRRKRV